MGQGDGLAVAQAAERGGLWSPSGGVLHVGEQRRDGVEVTRPSMERI